ncbi:hypothetical protein DRJ48_04400 [Candidatus Woesearchaeota archaeon]|nr:MAG: hypothetical protein DRJ48_04400 [Candidatus Woesearchaeota archaeon]
MREDVRQDLASIWSSALELIEEGDFLGLKELSNHTIHNSSIYHDEFSITAAVVVYSLAKIAQRGIMNVKRVCSLITKLLSALSKPDEDEYRKAQTAVLDYISNADKKFTRHVDDVLHQAKVKKGWKVYDHGLSLGTSAALLGISEWDLMNYVGNTTTTESMPVRTDVRSRLSYVRGLFT